MTREETRKARIVMQHFEDDGEVEVIARDDKDDKWQVTSNPTWNWAREDYRIKPQIMKVTEEEKEIISKPPIFWAKHKETGEINSHFGHAIKSFKKDHYILNSETMEWEDWDANADSRHHYNGGQP